MEACFLYRSFVLGRSPLAASDPTDRRHSASKLTDLHQRVPTASRNSASKTLLHLAQINSLSDQSRSSVTPSPSESSRKSSPADKPLNPSILPRSGENPATKKDDAKPASKTSSSQTSNRPVSSWAKRISLGAIGRQNATETHPEGLDSRPGVKSDPRGSQKTLVKHLEKPPKQESKSESNGIASKASHSSDQNDSQALNGAKRKVKARLVRQTTSFDFDGEPPSESSNLQNSLKDISTSSIRANSKMATCQVSTTSSTPRRKTSVGEICVSCQSAISRHRRGSCCSCVVTADAKSDANSDALRRRKPNLISLRHQQVALSDSYDDLPFDPICDVIKPAEVLARLCLVETRESPHSFEPRQLKKSNVTDTFCRKHKNSGMSSTGVNFEIPGLTVTADVHATPDWHGRGSGTRSLDYDPVLVLENDVANL